ncbi:MAG: hypothetical protein NTV43_00100 [Methylococcales bacterium]|nr:hypothetical protein [Methylococcales bacterium]
MIFDTFNKLLKHDERIQFTITRKGNQLAVLVQPVLQGAADEDASEAIQTLRAALSMPLYVITDPQTLDTDFPRSLAEFADVRVGTHNELGLAISRITEAGKQAKASAAKQADTPAKKVGHEQHADQDDNTASANPPETAASETAAPKTATAEDTKSLF